MALSNVEQAVLQKAEDEVKKILDEGGRAAKAYFERQAARMQEEYERRVEATRHELEGELERETGAKEAGNRLELLKFKNAIIEEVFEKAVKGVRTLPDNAYAAWVKAQVARVPQMKQAMLAANAEDQALLKEAVAAANRPELKISSEPANITGGFLVQGAQVDFDFSVESLMDTLRETLTEETSRKLFGEAES